VTKNKKTGHFYINIHLNKVLGMELTACWGWCQSYSCWHHIPYMWRISLLCGSYIVNHVTM